VTRWAVWSNGAMKAPQRSSLSLLVCMFAWMGVWTSQARAERSAFDAGHSVFLEAEIPEAELLTVKGPSARKAEILSQLHYLLGPLNELQGAPRLSTVTTEQLSVEYVNRSTGLRKVKYRAHLMIAWDRYAALPSQLELIVPARADSTGIQAFINAYAEECREGDRGDVTLNNFWYHFRPTYSGCPLLTLSAAEVGKAVRLKVLTKPSARVTQGESPEYGEMWKDGLLKVTIVSSKYESGAKDDSDVGVEAFNELYRSLRQAFGALTGPEPTFQGAPGGTNPRIDLQFQVPRGRVEIALFLVDGVRETGPAFSREFGALSKVSDLVIYNGHAGLGANIRALIGMAQAEKGRYQLYVLNGCDTFAYLDDALFKLHAAANPGEAGSRYVDIVSNSRPAYFAYMADTSVVFLQAIAQASGTFHEILEKTHSSQRALVEGEEDNQWPAPFRP